MKLSIKMIDGGKPLSVIRKALSSYYAQQDKAEWLAERQAEYDLLYPINRDCTQDEYETELGLDYDVPEYETLTEYPQIAIDYSEDETYKTFDEWIAETKVVTEAIEAIYDEDGLLLTEEIKEVTELVRPYIAPESFDDLVDAYLLSINYQTQEVKDALKYLADTDWMVVRFAETGVAIDEEVVAKRAECREIV